MKRDPYPLQWPEGSKRTRASARSRSRFGGGGGASLAHARREMLLELDRLGAANVVITSDLPTRTDGLPYYGRAEDPGIAVWFVLDGREHVFACDRWLTHAENMTAIARSVEAMRGLERWGMADVVNRAFAGFAALPPAPLPPVRRPWREVLGVSAVEGSFEVARRAYRARIVAAHPDRGGSHEVAAELNVAMAAAESELGAR